MRRFRNSQCAAPALDHTRKSQIDFQSVMLTNKHKNTYTHIYIFILKMHSHIYSSIILCILYICICVPHYSSQTQVLWCYIFLIFHAFCLLNTSIYIFEIFFLIHQQQSSARFKFFQLFSFILITQLNFFQLQAFFLTYLQRDMHVCSIYVLYTYIQILIYKFKIFQNSFSSTQCLNFPNLTSFPLPVVITFKYKRTYMYISILF